MKAKVSFRGLNTFGNYRNRTHSPYTFSLISVFAFFHFCLGLRIVKQTRESELEA